MPDKSHHQKLPDISLRDPDPDFAGKKLDVEAPQHPEPEAPEEPPAFDSRAGEPWSPEHLAFLLWRDGLLADQASDVQERIAGASTITEAIKVARDFGVEVEKLPNWSRVDNVIKREAFDAPRPSVLSERTPGGFTEGGAGYLGEDRFYEGLTESVLESLTDEEFAYIADNAIEELGGVGEPAGIRSRLIPEGFTPDDFAIYRNEVLLDDEYSPFVGADRFRRKEDPGYFIWKQRQEWGADGGRFFEEPSSEEVYYWESQLATPDYAVGDALNTWQGLSARTKARLENKMERAGILQEGGYRPGAMGRQQIRALEKAMYWGQELGVGYEIALDGLVSDEQRFLRFKEDNQAPPPRGGGRGVSTPAKFRAPASEIPDYESITQEVRNVFERQLGRRPKDSEMAVMADNLQDQYRTASQARIEAARAAFDQAQSGKSGILEFEIPDPGLRNLKYIQDRYAPEIERGEQVRDTAQTSRLMIDALTKGGRMVG